MIRRLINFLLTEVLEELATIKDQLKGIMAKVSSLGTRLTAIETTLSKVKTEIETLIAAAGDAELPADVEASVERLEALGAALDALNPDAPVTGGGETPAP